MVWISIHALREEGDACRKRICGLAIYFYPRPPRGGRLDACNAATEIIKFLSTPSARRATGVDVQDDRFEVISIHALREEGDTAPAIIPIPLPNFYPRPPRGGRHKAQASAASGPVISIHALREEGDRMRDIVLLPVVDFYPRPPRGGRHPYHCSDMPLSEISIHALREEGDHRQRPRV